MRPARLLLVTALVAGGLCACESTGRHTDRPRPAAVPAPVVLGTGVARSVEPQFVPAFEALQAALEAADTRLARRILARIWMRRPKGPARELAAGFERIVAGRECAASVVLALECRPSERASAPSESASDTGASASHFGGSAPPSSGSASQTSGSVSTATRAEPGPMRIVLRASSTAPKAFGLRPGPATLVVTHTAVDARGNEQRSVETRSYGDLSELAFAPGHTLEIELAELSLPWSDDALAVRTRVELDLRSGSFLRDGKEFPAQDLRVAAGEATARRAALDRAGPAAPDELAALARPGKVSMASALEIAVRVAPADRARALDSMWPLLDTLPEVEVTRLVPALRWLALTSEPGGGAAAWRAYLRNRNVARHTTPVRERLELPRPPVLHEAQSRIALERGKRAKVSR